MHLATPRQEVLASVRQDASTHEARGKWCNGYLQQARVSNDRTKCLASSRNFPHRRDTTPPRRSHVMGKTGPEPARFGRMLRVARRPPHMISDSRLIMWIAPPTCTGTHCAAAPRCLCRGSRPRPLCSSHGYGDRRRPRVRDGVVGLAPPVYLEVALPSMLETLHKGCRLGPPRSIPGGPGGQVLVPGVPSPAVPGTPQISTKWQQLPRIRL
jgi:hypothetical protein